LVPDLNKKPAIRSRQLQRSAPAPAPIKAVAPLHSPGQNTGIKRYGYKKGAGIKKQVWKTRPVSAFYLRAHGHINARAFKLLTTTRLPCEQSAMARANSVGQTSSSCSCFSR
jgi:hypothetical protein